MVKNFQESFNSISLRDDQTTALWDVLNGDLRSGLEAPGLSQRVYINSNVSVGASILDDKRNILYYVKYKIDPSAHISIGRFDIIKKQHLSDISLNNQDTVDKLVLSPDHNTLFLLSSSSGKITRINLQTSSLILNTISISKVKDIVFHANGRTAWIAGDSLYEIDTLSLTSDLNPVFFSYNRPEVLDIAINESQEDLVFLTKDTLGPALTIIKLNHLSLQTKVVEDYTLLNGNPNLQTSFIPFKIAIKDKKVYGLGNSFSNPKLFEVDLSSNLINNVNIPLGNISQDSLKDIIISDKIYISHSDDLPNTTSSANNVIFVYDFNLVLERTINLPLGAVSGFLLKDKNELYSVPQNKPGTMCRINLLDDNITQEIHLGASLFKSSKPDFKNNHICFTNIISTTNNVYLYELRKVKVDFGKGTRSLVIDGLDPNSCLLDGVVIEGGPFNNLNPYVLQSSEFASVQLVNNAVVTYPSNLDGLILRCTKEIIIDNTSKIIANGLGFRGGQKGFTNELGEIKFTATNGSGPGAGYSGSNLDSVGNSGGFAGSGAGHSLTSTNASLVPGGKKYGSKIFEFLELGSGGGAGSAKTGEPLSVGGSGGAGGGAIALIAPSIQIDGQIEVKGTDGDDGINYGGGGGAGSGGSIHIQSLELSGSGNLDSSGGTGGNSVATLNSALSLTLFSGSNGSPGRVRIDSLTDNSILTVIGEEYRLPLTYRPRSIAISKIIDTEEYAPVKYLNYVINGLALKFNNTEFIKVSSQTSNITFNEISFDVNQSDLMLFKNGKLVKENEYIKTSTTELTFTNPLDINDLLTAISLKDADTFFDSSLDFNREIPTVSTINSNYYLDLVNTYKVGKNSLLVFKNQEIITDYIEESNSRVKLTSDPDLLDEFEIFSFNPARVNLKVVEVSSELSTIAFDYLAGSNRLLVFKNGILLNKEEYKELENLVKFNNTLNTGDLVVLVEIKTTNISSSFAENNTPSGVFKFDKFNVNELKERYFKWKITLDSSLNLSPIIEDINFDVADFTIKPYVNFNLKEQVLSFDKKFQLEWATFNLSNLELQIKPDKASGFDKFTVSFNRVSNIAQKCIFHRFLLGSPVLNTETKYFDTSSSVASFSNTLDLSGNNVLVFTNGVLQNSSDYIITNTTEIQFVNPLAPNSYVDGLFVDPGLVVRESFLNISSSTITTASQINSSYIWVFKNGLLLTEIEDYNITGPNTVELISFNSGDDIEIIFFDLSLGSYRDDIAEFSGQNIDIISRNTGFYFFDSKNTFLFKSGYFQSYNYDWVIKHEVNSEVTIPLASAFGTLEVLTNKNTEFILTGDSSLDPIIEKIKGYVNIDDIQKNKKVFFEEVSIIPGQDLILFNNSFAPYSKNLLVYANGILLDQSQYQELTSRSIKLTNPAIINTLISIFVFPDGNTMDRDLEILTSSVTSFEFSKELKNCLIYNNGRLLAEGTDYTVNEKTASFAKAINGKLEVLFFNANNIFLKQKTYFVTNTFQRDLVSKDFSYDLNTYKLQVYKKGILLPSANYEEKEAFSLRLTKSVNRNEIYNAVSFEFIKNGIINDPEPPVLDQEIGSSFGLQNTSGFIREDHIIEPELQEEILILEREDQLASANQQIFTINNFEYIPATKELVVFVNGVLQIEGHDYTEMAGGPVGFAQIQFASPRFINDKITFVKFNTAISNREDKISPTVGSNTVFFNNLTYIPESNELFIFRNGVLRRLNEDYTELSLNSVIVNPSFTAEEEITALAVPHVYADIFTASTSNVLLTSGFDFITYQNKTLVFKNGQLQIQDDDYTIDGTNIITFLNGALKPNDIIYIISPKVVIPIPFTDNFVETSNIEINAISKSLIFQNGVLLAEEIDYTKISDTEYTLINPIPSASTIDIINNHNFERVNIVISDPFVLTYEVDFQDTYQNEALVFLNGQLLNKDQDYIVSSNFYIFDPNLQLKDDDILSFVKFNTAIFKNQRIPSIGTSTVLPIPNDFREGFNELLLFRNGQLLRPIEDYIENESNSITLNFTPQLDDVFNSIFIQHGTQKTERKNLSLNALDDVISFQTTFDFSDQNVLVFFKRVGTPIPDVITILAREEQISVLNQITYTINDFTYTIGDNSLLVFVNGLMQIPNQDYSEASASTIDFINIPDPDANITFVKIDPSKSEREDLFEGTNFISGNTDITFTGLSYPGSDDNDILVFRNGALQTIVNDYSKLSSNSISFNEVFELEDEISAVLGGDLSFVYTELPIGIRRIQSSSINFGFDQKRALVFRNGVLQILDQDYVISSEDSIVFIGEVDKPSRVVICANASSIGGADGLLKLLSHGSDYTEETNKVIFPLVPNPTPPPNEITSLLLGDEISIVKLAAEVITTKETFIASGGETILDFKTFSHNPGQQKLLVFKNGKIITNTVEYNEKDALSIELLTPLSPGDVINFVHLSTNSFQLGYEIRNINTAVSTLTLENFNYKNSTALVFKDGLSLNPAVDYSFNTAYTLSFTSPISNASLVFIKPFEGQQELILGNGSQLINIITFTYSPGNNEIMVFKNGVLQTPLIDYQETSLSSITFTSVVTSADKILVVKASQIKRYQTTLMTSDIEVENINFGSNQFLIFKNGVFQKLNIDYIQVNLNKIKFINPVNIGDIVDFIDISNESVFLSANIGEENYLNTPSGEELFALNNFEYIKANRSLLVFQNGGLLKLNDEYEEENTKSFDLLTPTFLGDNLKALGFLVTREALLPTITLKNFEYEIEQKELIVFIDDKLKSRNVHYEEVNSKTVDFNLGVRELLFANGILLARNEDYDKLSVRQFELFEQPDTGETLDLIFFKILEDTIGKIVITNPNQVIYTLFTDYVPNSLLVFKNGILQTLGLDYLEHPANQIEFISNIEENDIIQYIYLHKFTGFNVNRFISTINQTSFVLSFSYDSNKILVFRNGVLQHRGVDYEEAPSSVIFLNGLTADEEITVINIQSSDFVRDNFDLDLSTTSIESLVVIPFLQESNITLDTKISFFKIAKEYISRVDYKPSTKTRIITTAPSTNLENILVFKDGLFLRNNRDYTLSSFNLILNKPIDINNLITVIQLDNSIKVNQEEIVVEGKSNIVKFDSPLRSNTYDYFIFLNGHFLIKDLNYKELDTSTLDFFGVSSGIQPGDLINKVTFESNNTITKDNLVFANIVSPGKSIYATDYNLILDKARLLSKVYGIRPIDSLLNTIQGNSISSDITLLVKNIFKYSNIRENSISNFSTIDQRLFETKSITSDSFNTLRDIVDKTQDAIPSAPETCLSAAEGRFPIVKNSGLRTSVLTLTPDTSTILNREEQTSFNGQQIFNLNTFTYNTGTQELFVFLDGLLQIVGQDYLEGGPTEIIFNNSLVANQKVTFIKLDDSKSDRQNFPNPTPGTNQTTFTAFSYTPGSNDLLFFRNGLLQKLGTEYTEVSSNTINVSPSYNTGEEAVGTVASDLTHESYTIGTSQNSIITTSFDFRVQSDLVLVFRNGTLQVKDIDYTFSGPKSIEDTYSKWQTGDYIELVGDIAEKKVYTTFYPYYQSILDKDFEIKPLQYFVEEENQLASAGQTVITLNNFTYSPDNEQIIVFKNGALQALDIDFEETSNSSITFINSLSASDNISIIKLNLELSDLDQKGILPLGSTSIVTDFEFEEQELFVFRDGILQDLDDDYFITTSQSFSFFNPVAGSEIFINILLKNAVRERYEANSGQDVFKTKALNANSPTIWIFKNGVVQKVGTDYEIIDSKTIKFLTTVNSGDVIIFVSPEPNFKEIVPSEFDLKITNPQTGISLTRETQNVILNSQNSFAIRTFECIPGTNNLLVFKNGYLQSLSFDYEEVTGNSIKFNSGLNINTNIDFILVEKDALILRDTSKPANGVTTITPEAGINPNKTLIWVNGILQLEGIDYTISSSNEIIFTNLFTGSDVLDIYYIPDEIDIAIENFAGNTDLVTITKSFIPSGLQIQVYKNGILQVPGTDYIEISSNSVQFIPGVLQDSDTVTIVHFDLGEDTQDLKGSARVVRVGACLVEGTQPSIDNNIKTQFIGTPKFVKPGEPVTLSWEVDNADNVTISGIGNVPNTGKLIVNPLSTTNYTIAASNSVDSIEKTITIRVIEPPTGNFSAGLSLLSTIQPQVSLAASSNTVVLGNTVFLNYSSQNVTTLEIDNGIGEVPLSSGVIEIEPTESAIYTIKGTGTNGNIVYSAVFISVVSSPIINFSSDKTTIKLGQSATLNWEVFNADSIARDWPGTFTNSGIDFVSPTTTTTYTITATNSAGTTISSLTITVEDPTPNVNFTANRVELNPSQATTLSWEVTNATKVTLDQGLGDQPLSGSIEVTPSSNTTYTLTAIDENTEYTTIKSLVINVRPGPVINFFNVDKQEVLIGEEVTLTWITSESATANIDPIIGQIPLQGSKKVKITQKFTNFTLTASNGFGGKVTQTVTVIAFSPPTIDYFQSSDDMITANSSITLSWSTKEAKVVTISEIGEVPPIGRKKLTILNDKTFTLLATNDHGSISKKIKIKTAPNIHVFVSEENQASFGDEVRVIWQTIGATNVEIEDIGPVSLSGSRKIKILKTTAVKLIAKNANTSTTKELLIKLVDNQ